MVDFSSFRLALAEAARDLHLGLSEYLGDVGGEDAGIAPLDEWWRHYGHEEIDPGELACFVEQTVDFYFDPMNHGPGDAPAPLPIADQVRIAEAISLALEEK